MLLKHIREELPLVYKSADLIMHCTPAATIKPNEVHLTLDPRIFVRFTCLIYVLATWRASEQQLPSSYQRKNIDLLSDDVIAIRRIVWNGGRH
jgi:hypothetical protein